MTLELYRVTVQYMPPSKRDDWDKRLKEHVRHSPSEPFAEPLPSPNVVTYHAATFGDFGVTPVDKAARLPLGSVVGSEDSWERFQAQVTAIEYIGSVVADESN